ncbi:tRNA uridine 5-carboxymethylaminomethyl modification enzyme MnmG [Rubripirellula lacrimiformis]|uniref:tRNA uridine 5-carboxymethylaminomethyl modification enzyme MnmG n=1 Tax=Rubripirellula lacrimiformis TaxID=1930273 RepID=A0A517N832_9BACT|nr:FAD-dependent oxidoreductase [Rubripirellula lacrimiformis]QDT03297.1 tRNA uridine 5-carboxymethylaminomethyl modification enzyme MnmG [Rubripirellula lacrimiformis]
MSKTTWITLFALILMCPRLSAAEIFVETESFEDLGGWKLDTQFIQQMGSPYLLAHGLGQPVDDATTKIQVDQAGKYRVWVRTFDWVARWGAQPSPGKFQVVIGELPLDETFGTQGDDWGWHDGGTVNLDAGTTSLRLHDLTGFNGRCDCLYLTTDLATEPPDASGVLSDWRRGQLGLPSQPRSRGPYDLVVVGGGYSGMGAALSAARMGCRVALVQDRPVLGGNGSSEVRVWAMGNIRRGKFPRIGEIIEEFADNAKKSPGTYEEFGDDLKESVVRAEPNIDLLLNHHAYAAEMDGQKIQSISALDTRSGQEVKILGNYFVDCTGHGWLGGWAGADMEMAKGGRMGMSNMWAWDEAGSPTQFPKTPWALDLNMEDFPYPRDHHGQWFWESGFDKDALGGAEAIRDWNLRAVFGAFNAMKNRDGAGDHADAILTWVAYIGGPRESQRLMGDVVLNQDDVVAKRDFPDGCVPSTWSIDLHYPKEEFADKFPDNPFISKAVHDRRVDRSYGYPVPYRCFYSRNIDNLFMAGRCISVTHEALGTVRVMKTCGMMGEVVGKAASICAINQCSPRDVYADHLGELLTLLELPGKARRSTPSAPIVIPDDALPLAGPLGPPTGKSTDKLEGIVVDDVSAKFTGKWTEGAGLKGYVGYGYRYASGSGDATATFVLKPKTSGQYEVRFFTSAHENRSTRTPVAIQHGDLVRQHQVDQRQDRELDYVVVDQLPLQAGQDVIVTVQCGQADGNVHVDAVSLVEVK